MYVKILGLGLYNLSLFHIKLFNLNRFNIIEQLASGKAGKNIHALGGELKGYKAIDMAGTGSGRGAGRVIFKETSEHVEIIGVVKGHNYNKIIK